MAAQSECLAEADLFKKTAIGDYVIRRHCRLFPDRFATYRDPADSRDSRDYPLSADATLVPATPDEINRKTRRVRPEGVGHLTALAAAAGKGREVELWSFRLDSGHHQFHFGFEDAASARDFHDALTKQLGRLRAAADAADAAANGGGGAAAGGTSGGGGGGDLMTVESVPMIAAGGRQVRAFPVQVMSSLDSDASDDEDGEISALLNFAPGTTTPAAAAGGGGGRRWVPYRHTNGVAIYKHCGRGPGGVYGQDGDEYMVSAVVRGRPSEALRALMDPASATTVLGPAREVEIVESSPGKQVLRIQVQAPGAVGARLAPREARVARVLRREAPGIYVLLFSPADGVDAFEGQGVVEEVEGLDDGAHWARPVRCRVGGGFTISRLAGAAAGADSPECLVTLVLNVQDLGGWLSPRNWLRRTVLPTWAVTAATEALVGRMLMSVTLVRDAVEQGRFAIHPGVMRAPSLAEPAAGEPDLQRSATLLMRRAAQQASSATAAGGPKPKPTRLMSTRQGSVQSSVGAAAAAASAIPEEAAAAAVAAADGAGAQPPCGLDSSYYEELHTPGHDAPFRVRGPNYLQDGQKVVAGVPVFDLVGVEIFETDGPVQHVSRYLAPVRSSPRPFLFVYNLIVPGPPTLSLVFIYATDTHPDALQTPPEDPDEGDWTPFDWLIYRFLRGTDEDRSGLFKMIPHIAQGSWVIRSAVGTTPVIVARKLASKFYVTDKYVEVCVDVGSNATANYVTGLVRGATRSLVIDLALLLEGQHAYELPEVLIGACRLVRLDLSKAQRLDTSGGELPLRPSARKPAGAAAAAAAPAAVAEE